MQNRSGTGEDNLLDIPEKMKCPVNEPTSNWKKKSDPPGVSGRSGGGKGNGGPSR